jgi:hypothetical protein
MNQKFEIQADVGQAQANAAGTVIFSLLPGYRYKNLKRQLTTPTGTSVITVNYAGDTRLKINGNVQRVLTPTRLDEINRLNNPPSATLGTAAATPYTMLLEGTTKMHLTEFFHEPWGLNDPTEQFALDVLEGDNVTLEVDYASAAVAPIVKLFAEAEPLAMVLADRNRGALNRAGGRPMLVKYLRGSDVAGGATWPVTKLNKGFSQEEAVQHIRFIDPSDATIDEVSITINKKLWLKATKYQNYIDLRAHGMNPATGFFDIVPQASGFPRDAMTIGPRDDVQVDFTFSGASAAAINWIIQAYGPAI